MNAIIILVAIGCALAISALLILVGRVFYPYHRHVATIVYIISWIPFIYSFIAHRKWLNQHAETVQGFFAAYPYQIVLGILLIFFLYVAKVLIPLEASPLKYLSKGEIQEFMERDTTSVLVLEERLEVILDQIKENTIFQSEQTKFTVAQKQKLREQWSEFLQLLLELDIIKQRYRGFPHINIVTQKAHHADAFMIAYSAFITQYTSSQVLSTCVTENEAVATLLNEQQLLGTFPTERYSALQQDLTHPDTMLKINAGRAYFALMKPFLSQTTLLEQPTNKKIRLINTSLRKYSSLVIKKPLRLLEQKTLSLWFPIQKKAATQLSYIRGTNRDYFITSTKLQEFLPQFEPGDIFLERRNWHATNVGIPGYWPHAAFFVGTLEELDIYFADIPSLAETTASQHIKEQYPTVYTALQVQQKDGFLPRMIEAKRPGVVLFSLEESANADSLGVLRPRISKEEKFAAILRAFSHYGKPYDFKFNFISDSELVCSELVYKALQEAEGMTLETKIINGRPLFSPNQIAEKFTTEYQTKFQELDFILFLDANEQKQTVDQKDVHAFIESVSRPKWYILLEDS